MAPSAERSRTWRSSVVDDSAADADVDAAVLRPSSWRSERRRARDCGDALGETAKSSALFVGDIAAACVVAASRAAASESARARGDSAARKRCVCFNGDAPLAFAIADRRCAFASSASAHRARRRATHQIAKHFGALRAKENERNNKQQR